MVANAPDQIGTNYDFVKAALTQAGLPATDNNAANLLRWISTEKPSASFWYQGNNPLNLNTQHQKDGYDRYPSIGAGATATAAFLNMPNYTSVKAVLASNGSPADFSAAVVRSPWADSHYGVAAAGAASKWIVAGRGLDYIATVPAPAVYKYDGSKVGEAPAGGASVGTVALNNPGAADVAIMCRSDNGFSLPLVGGNFFNGCQVKGLIGGLLVGFGGAVLLGGLILIAGKTKTGQQIVSGVTSVAGGPAGAVAGAVRRRSTSTAPEVEEATVSAPAPAPRTQVERSAEGRARLSPDVLADARRRRVEAGLQSA